MINVNRKGKVAERSFRDLLHAAGYTSARRGQQFAGGTDSPDVICAELSAFHFEVKNRERGNVFAFMQQAERDAGAAKIPIVAMRRNLHPFLVVIRSRDFFTLLRNCDPAALTTH